MYDPRSMSCLVALLLCGPALAQNTWFVDDNTCPSVGDGSNLNPFCSIQDAIDIASDTDEIIVAIGTYFETIDFLGKAITVRSTDPSDHATVMATIINGNSLGSVVTCVSGEGPDTVLNGLTITGGSGTPFAVFPTHFSFAGGGMLNFLSSPTVTNCSFSGNSADDGGGMYNHNSFPTVTNCSFSGNSADCGGGMYNNLSGLTITNCTFSGNTANNLGGGMLNNLFSGPRMSNCTFSGNTAFLFGGGGSAIANSDTSCPFINNCIIQGNGFDPIKDQLGSTTHMDYSNIQGGFAGVGNIDADPLFVDWDGPDNIPGNEDDDFHLSPDSPCIDAGFNWAIPQPEFDLDGLPRYADRAATPDTGCGFTFVVDMGAYEFQGIPGTPCRGDTNGSGVTNVTDLLALLASWGMCGTSCCIADFDGSGFVNVTDLLAMLAAWGPCP